ncbi:MAG TPA: hypothetical protein ENI11_02920 [Actinobacteria bacterium]|nr:hypothetical protein [Actinomycetota bacterium]
MAKKKNNKEEETICEFFGIKLTTKNPHVARILTTDVRTVLDRDVKAVDESNDPVNYESETEEVDFDIVGIPPGGPSNSKDTSEE